MYERNGSFGGAIKSEPLTMPGYQHDTFSAWHLLWVDSAAHAELGEELAARGLDYLNTELATSVRCAGCCSFALDERRRLCRVGPPGEEVRWVVEPVHDLAGDRRQLSGSA